MNQRTIKELETEGGDTISVYEEGNHVIVDFNDNEIWLTYDELYALGRLIRNISRKHGKDIG